MSKLASIGTRYIGFALNCSVSFEDGAVLFVSDVFGVSDNCFTSNY